MRLAPAWLLSLGLVVAGCSPPPTPPPSAVATPSGSASGPLGVVIASEPLAGLIALAAGGDGVWYVRSAGGHGWVGYATTAQAPRETPAGPAPLAIAATSEAVYVLEGAAEGAEPTARTKSLERLDRVTLTVEASVMVPVNAADLVVAGGRPWLVTTRGELFAYEPSALSLEQTVDLGGRGPARLAADSGEVWVGQAQVSGAETRTFLYGVPTSDPDTRSMTSIPGSTVFAVSAGIAGVWLATGTDVGGGELHPYANGGFGPPVQIRAPNALAQADGRVYWVSADGHLGAVVAATPADLGVLRISSGAADVEIAGGFIWVAADQLVVIRPSS